MPSPFPLGLQASCGPVGQADSGYTDRRLWQPHSGALAQPGARAELQPLNHRAAFGFKGVGIYQPDSLNKDRYFSYYMHWMVLGCFRVLNCSVVFSLSQTECFPNSLNLLLYFSSLQKHVGEYLGRSVGSLWALAHHCIRELDCNESWVLKNWCFWIVVLEKTLESP